jgi:hypothetical protein
MEVGYISITIFHPPDSLDRLHLLHSLSSHQTCPTPSSVPHPFLTKEGTHTALVDVAHRLPNLASKRLGEVLIVRQRSYDSVVRRRVRVGTDTLYRFRRLDVPRPSLCVRCPARSSVPVQGEKCRRTHRCRIAAFGCRHRVQGGDSSGTSVPTYHCRIDPSMHGSSGQVLLRPPYLHHCWRKDFSVR